MIELNESALPRELELKLRQWLTQPGMDVALRVAAHRAAAIELEAMNKLSAGVIYDQESVSLGAFQDSLERAGVYKHFMKVIQELAGQPHDEPFQSVQPTVTTISTDHGP